MYIRVPDNIKYYIHIEGEGPPVVLLHGFTGSHSTWRALTDELHQQYQTIAIDLLGHGRSDCPENKDRYRMDRTIEDLFYIINELKLESIRLVGYSMGGRVAIAFALTYPKLVKQLIVESSSPGLSLSSEREARVASDNSLATRIEQDGLAWFARYWGDIPLFASQKQLSKETQQQLVESRLNNNALGLANSLRGIGTGQQTSYWQRMKELIIPVTFIVGEYDEKYVTLARKMQEEVRQAQVIVIRQAGHNVHLEKPTQFLEKIKQVLQ